MRAQWRIQRNAPPNYKLKHFILMWCYAPILIFFILAALIELIVQVDERSPAYEEIIVMKNNRFCYFSVWNFGLQILFMIVCVCDSVANIKGYSLELQNRIYKFRCYLFTGAVFPFTILTMMGFWGLYYISRELVLVPDVFQAVPNWFNHTLHTVIILPVIIELFLSRTYLDLNMIPCVLVTISIYVLQTILCRWVYQVQGKWVYPLFSEFGEITSYWLGILGFLLAVGFTYLGVYIHNTKVPRYTRRRGRLLETMD